MTKNRKIFITGGAGFIGSHLCERLVEDNKLVIYDNGYRNALKMTTLYDHPNISYIKGDVCMGDDVEKSMKGCDTVIHCAAIAGIDTVIKDPLFTMQVDLFGTDNVLKAAAKNKVKHLINFSTSEVYGPVAHESTEDSPTTQGKTGEIRWGYAVSKIAGEHLACCYARKFNIPIINIRPFNVYGPRQVGESAISKFVTKAVKGEDMVVYNHGTQIRAWCYINDFLNGIQLCLDNSEAANKTFNIGNQRGAATTLELAHTIKQLSNSDSKIVFENNSAPDVKIRIPSIELISNTLGYEPKDSLREGLEKTISWYKSNIKK